MSTLTARAPAKLNLTLRVLGRRPDGFHELESLVAIVDATDPACRLCDTLTITGHENGCYAFDCDDPTLPRDGSNLVLAAARALARTAGVNRGAEITLQKRIPAGSGLGGGSSDAAATLRLLNEIWELNFSPGRLAEIGAEVGSDVPLFFHGPLCVMRGRGERVDRVARSGAAQALWAVVLLPTLHCSTPAVYAAWDRQHSDVADHADPVRPEWAQLVGALENPSPAMHLLCNDLEAPAFEVCSPLRELHARVEQLAGGPVRMTGSGAGLFRLFGAREAALDFAATAAAATGIRAETVRIV